MTRTVLTIRRSAIVALVCTVTALIPSTSVSAATAQLPDLGMARLQDISTQTVNGQRRLLFSTVIVNVGEGKFQVEGKRGPSSSLMSTEQRIFDSDGQSRVVPTAAKMHYSGDAHDHWHVRNLATYQLIRASDGADTGISLKSGFCFYDNYKYRLDLTGAPASPVYEGCGHRPDSAVTMGLSVGWGDLYDYRLPDQYIDITGMQPGRYRLHATADKNGWFTERSEGNNTTWADLELTSSGSLRVLAHGPSAQPASTSPPRVTPTTTTPTTTTPTTTTSTTAAPTTAPPTAPESSPPPARSFFDAMRESRWGRFFRPNW